MALNPGRHDDRRRAVPARAADRAARSPASLVALVGVASCSADGNPLRAPRRRRRPRRAARCSAACSAWAAYTLHRQAHARRHVAARGDHLCGADRHGDARRRRRARPASSRCRSASCARVGGARVTSACSAPAVAFVWFYEGVQRIGPARAAVFINLVPVARDRARRAAAGRAARRSSMIVGGALVIAGVWILNRPAATPPCRSRPRDAMLLTEEQQLVRDTMRAFAQERARAERRALGSRAHFPREELRALGELGALGMVVPERWGGAGDGLRVARGGARGDRRRRRRDVDDRQRAELGRLRADQSRSAPTRRRRST